MSQSTVLIVDVVISAWLVVCAYCDWRKREVPNILTVTPFLIAVIWSAIFGNAAAALLAVTMMFVANLDRWPAIAVMLLSLVLAIILSIFIQGFTIQAVLPIIVVLVVILLYYFGVSGGADAKVLIAVVLLCGYTPIVYAVVAGGLVGLIGLAKRKQAIPYMLPIAAGTIVYFVFNLTQFL